MAYYNPYNTGSYGDFYTPPMPQPEPYVPPPMPDPWEFENPTGWTPPTAPTPGELAAGQQAAFDAANAPSSDGSSEPDIEQQIADLLEELTKIQPYDIDWSTTQVTDDEGNVTTEYGDTYGQVTDSEGNIIKDYGNFYDQLRELAAANIQTLDEYMGDKSFNDPLALNPDGSYANDAMASIMSLADEMAGGPTTADETAAADYAASILGMTTAEYETAIDSLSEVMAGGVNSAEGMSEEEQALRERANRNELRYMEQRAQRQIENIMASTGSASRSYAAADEAMRTINDAQVQQDIALADEMKRRREAQFASQEKVWEQMKETNQISNAQYLQLVQNSKAKAFEAYATEIDAMFQQNSEYLERYRSDLAGVEMALNNTYRAIMTEMGLDATIMDFIEDNWNMAMAPTLQQIEVLLAQQGVELAQNEQAQSNTMDWITIGLQAAGIVVPFLI